MKLRVTCLPIAFRTILLFVTFLYCNSLFLSLYTVIHFSFLSLP